MHLNICFLPITQAVLSEACARQDVSLEVEVEMAQTWVLSSGTSPSGRGTRGGAENEKAVVEATCQIRSPTGIWILVHQGKLIGKGAFYPYQAR